MKSANKFKVYYTLNDKPKHSVIRASTEEAARVFAKEFLSHLHIGKIVEIVSIEVM